MEWFLKKFIEFIKVHHLIKMIAWNHILIWTQIFRKKAKKNLEKNFFELINNTVFGKTMENVRTHRDNKLVRTGSRRNYLLSEPNYDTKKFFIETLLAIEMKKKQQTYIWINLSIFGLPILELIRILI